MLEHLPETVYCGALKQFGRVAAKYILITVPNRDSLRENLSVCGNCGHKFHIWGHVRRYGPKNLPNLFTNFSLLKLSEFGLNVPHYNPLLLWTKQMIGGAWAWDEDSPCPECHERIRKLPVFPLVSRVCDALNTRLWARFFIKKAWMLALYRRTV
jgi:hypothetical protein